jgi:cytosine/adenosine deaminase-related metal-dependent hydrolase
LGDELGSLQPGKRADLVILDADPLEHFESYRRIWRVMKDGAFVERDALPVQRILTADTQTEASTGEHPALVDAHTPDSSR